MQGVVDSDNDLDFDRPVPAAKTSGRHKSWVWKYFSQVFKTADGNEWTTCTIPSESDGTFRKVAWSGTTTNLSKHIERHHKEVFLLEKEESPAAPEAPDSRPVAKPKVLPPCFGIIARAFSTLSCKSRQFCMFMVVFKQSQEGA